MKILPVEKIREADAYTIEHEPVKDIDLMERAARKCFEWLYQHIPSSHQVKVIAGSGNNGGDGLAIARMLVDRGYDVEVFLIGDKKKLSPSCTINYNRFIRKPGGQSRIVLLPETTQPEGNNIPFPPWGKITGEVVVIDALFGSGLTRPVTGVHAQLIDFVNKLEKLIVSIDVPSGLFIDKTVNGADTPVIIRADYTLTFAPPKLGFFFPENDPYIGEWVLLDIGLSFEFLSRVEVKNFMVTAASVKPLLRKRNKFDHKGTFGHALLVCGGKGKMGAAILAAGGCLRSGSGLVTVRVPRSAVDILQTAVPEAMIVIDPNEEYFSEVPDLSGYTAIAVGPGIGMEKPTVEAFKQLIQAGLPMVIDADAITILGENKTWLSFLPPGCILTPHVKEFERIAGKATDDFHRNQLQRDLSFRHSCYILLKGAYTAITTPNGNCFFNTTGNPGMATGGSGDVLTGLIAGLIAQKYPPLEAALLGVYLHGLAGDLAAGIAGQEALTATDIINHIGNAYLSLYGEL
ncbi:MAG: NAD(P)H-hydrate dehydratase [Bacteroidales bacterium]|nr:NAD(P)H-hydrate dehydratase [Bacteroidales bacterium]